ncbi:anthocyanidin 3-O-glucosyltransferase 2-like [Cornus florida]|uniref:anthocyanidin 3-O-glucosyltransferase 2-like n=1 Tax=Cornus florida TaxID=4283 RepID=UPI002896DDC2|nr:anthocyanidin 3-O-glucosyltransferase 2-like [Cornus florida]
MTMKKAELLFIPAPGSGHLTAAVEMAKLLVDRDERLSITVIIMKMPSDSKAITQTQSTAEDDNSRIRYMDLPQDSPELKSKVGFGFIDALIESKKTHVRDAAAGITGLAGLVLDMFCTTMIDVADEFGVPSYVFFTSSAASLGFIFHLQSLQDDQNQDFTELKGSDAELSVPSFSNSVPIKVMASLLLENKSECRKFLDHPRRFRKTKGIIANTFTELESHAVKSLWDGNTPPVYPVGPVLKLKGDEGTCQQDAIMSWLDDQPPASVVFLCFGSMGCFSEPQVKEIAHALEQSGHRFLWSLRQPPPKGMMLPGEYANPDEVLPEGFLERTAEIGKVIGWAPQVAVLSHPAVGGFVSHCGWNSILESVWCGVPMAAWPLYAEQQQNAFEMVRELGLAVEIKMDYRMNSDQPVLTAKEIESKIRLLMMEDGEIRKKVKEMKEKSREAMMEGGSSFISLGHLIDDVIKNMESHSH